MKEKAFIAALGLIGISCVGYGMVGKDHPVFVVGLVLVAAAYLMFRKKLKAYIRENYPSETDRREN